MKKIYALFALIFFINLISCGTQKNEDRKSPHTTVKQTIASGSEIAISYGQCQVKGRTIGKDLEPFDGKVWRAGADEATVFETSKAIKVNGKLLPAGKYSFFTLTQNNECTLIFNKTWDQWGAYDYKEKDDVLRVKVKFETGVFTEKMAYTIETNGKILLLWGDVKVGFVIE
jgi:Protein of unknown function (DUF2911)